MSQEIAQPPTHNDFFEEVFRQTNKSEKGFFALSECVVIIIIYLFPIFFLKANSSSFSVSLLVCVVGSC